jgi:Zn-dependent protease with chaperone function
MSEYHCRVYGEHGTEAQSTHLRIEDGRLRLTDSAYANYELPFDNVSISLFGSGPICAEFKVRDQPLTIIVTDLDILTELAEAARDTALGTQAVELKRSLVKKHRSNRKKWLILAGIIAGLPILGLILLDSGLNYFIARAGTQYEDRLGVWIAQAEKGNKESPEAQRVRRVGDKLVSKVAFSPYKFQFLVDKDETVNACAYPGGLIVANTGLLKAANDDELAGVLGHEIGHVLHRDTLRATMHNLGTGLSLAVFTHLLGLDQSDDMSTEELEVLMQNFEGLRYSRAQEADADAEGVRLAMKAGYTGDGLVHFFEKEKAKNGEPTGIAAKLTGLFSTHPLDAERIAAIRAEVEKIKLQEKKEGKPKEEEKKAR